MNQWNKEIRLIWPACVCLWVKPKTSVMNIFLYNRNLVIFQDLGLSNCGRFVIQNAYRLYSISFFSPIVFPWNEYWSWTRKTLFKRPSVFAPNILVYGGYYQCWVVIRVILKAHHHGSQKIKEPISDIYP